MSSTSGMLARLKARMRRSSLRSARNRSTLPIDEPLATTVSVNVYDMLWLNVYTNSLGIGVYHTGVVVYETEYGYGGHPLSYSGIFAMPPRDSESLGPNYSFKTNILLGHTDFTESDIALILEDMGPEYRGDQYHLLRHNCNHFSNAFAQILCGSRLPKWINRLASVGAKLPLVERSIPKMWLTPRPLGLEDVSHLEQTEGIIDRRPQSCHLVPSVRSRRESSKVESECLANSYKDKVDHEEMHPHLITPTEVSQQHVSMNRLSEDTVCGYNSEPTFPCSVIQFDNSSPVFNGILSGSQDGDGQDGCAPRHSHSMVLDYSSSSSDNPLGNGVDKVSVLRRLTLPVSNFIEPKRPASVYLFPEVNHSPEPSGCSLLYATPSISDHSQRNCSFNSVDAPPKQWSVMCKRTGLSFVGSQPCSSPNQPNCSTKSQRRSSMRSATSSSSSNPPNRFAVGLVSRLKAICGVSQTDDEPDFRT